MRGSLLALILIAGCAQKTPAPPTVSPSTTPPAPASTPGKTTQTEAPESPADLDEALALAGLSPCPGAGDKGSGFALSKPEEGGGKRLHAAFHSTEKPEDLASLYSKQGLEQLNKVGDLQLAGKSKNGSDVILMLKPAEGGGTDVEVRAILYE